MSDPVWRFGYGSNMGLSNLKKKKNLTPLQYVPGVVEGWTLSFDLGGIDHVDPSFACVRRRQGEQVHGVAFLLNPDDAARLDREEGGYVLTPVRFDRYGGGVIEGVGLYAPKTPATNESRPPSLRYLRLLQNGAAEAGLSPEYQQKLADIEFYVTAPAVRAQTLQWIAEFEQDPARKDVRWTAEQLATHNGKDPDLAPHTSCLGYVVRVRAPFPSWRGHTITRRNILHFRGESIDTGDIRVGKPGFLPLPDVTKCTAEELEFLYQNLDSLLHRGGFIVGRLSEFVAAQP